MTTKEVIGVNIDHEDTLHKQPTSKKYISGTMFNDEFGFPASKEQENFLELEENREVFVPTSLESSLYAILKKKTRNWSNQGIQGVEQNG